MMTLSSSEPLSQTCQNALLLLHSVPHARRLATSFAAQTFLKLAVDMSSLQLVPPIALLAHAIRGWERTKSQSLLRSSQNSALLTFANALMKMASLQPPPNRTRMNTSRMMLPSWIKPLITLLTQTSFTLTFVNPSARLKMTWKSQCWSLTCTLSVPSQRQDIPLPLSLQNLCSAI